MSSQLSAQPQRTRLYQNHHLDSTRWDAYAPRDDDIIITTSYKSGATWMQGIMREVIVASMQGQDEDRLPLPADLSSPWVGARWKPVEEIYETIEAQQHRRFLKSHLPTCGYLITHKAKDVSIYHMGDLHEVYPALENLKGRVDFLVHMKLGFKDWSILLQFLDYVEPRFWIPTHYRTDRKSDPIPEGHWPPNIDDPAAFIEDLRDHIGDRTRILPFTAGVEYAVELPSKRVNWQWKWVNTWTTPPWAP